MYVIGNLIYLYLIYCFLGLGDSEILLWELLICIYKNVVGNINVSY